MLLTTSKFWLSLLLVGLLALAVYWPGIHGGFLFDDYGSLPALGAQGPVVHWHTFWRYITSGTADPTGRPLAMLTFLLDTRDWPASPFPFKRTNLILHLLNGALLYALLARLGSLLAIESRRARPAALLGCTLWLLHPLLVSTTLYIVQREAMLVATCSMTGLLLWLHGREQIALNRLKAGVTWSVLGLGSFMLLGTLSKANGALLPIYALLIEAIVLTPYRPISVPRGQRAYRAIMFVFGIIPATVIGIYLIYTGIHGMLLGHLADNRSWSYAQRLMTEPRVLVDYLQLLWLPRPFSSGLFNDQYAASTSWLHPATTLPALFTILTLITAAWWQRRRHPALALAVLFYFAGQLLESTSIPLELYFEHRNYVPALLMFWPLSLWLTDRRNLYPIKIGLMSILPLMLAGMTYTRATVWGNVQTQGLIWAKINPDSPRAQANAAEIEIANGQPQRAAIRIENLLAAQPDQAQLAFNLIDARCMMGGVDTSTLEIAQKAMSHTAGTGTLFARWFDGALRMAESGRCSGLTPSTLLMLIDAGLKNPRLSAPGPQQDLTYLRGRIAVAEHQPNVALANFVQALDLHVRPDFALQAAATLGAAGYPSQGLTLLDHYQHIQTLAAPPGVGMPALHAWVLERQHYWPNELTRLRKQLSLDVQAVSANTAHSDSAKGMIH